MKDIPIGSPARLQSIELFAWLGEDELGSREVGLKQGIVPAGCIPLVAVRFDKMEKQSDQMAAPARNFGKKIYLCRFTLDCVMWSTESGEPLA